MKEKAVSILHENRLMAISTIRPDGWPQTTMVGYANEGILIYFMVSRESQKFQNIARDDRVSAAIGRDFHDPSTIKAVSIAARASEVRDAKQRERALKMLLDRHPGLQSETAYFNIHTTTFAGGEIRGFLTAVPEPQSWALMITGFGLVGAAMRRRRRLAVAAAH